MTHLNSLEYTWELHLGFEEVMMMSGLAGLGRRYLPARLVLAPVQN